jgi:hypothetical protein
VPAVRGRAPPAYYDILSHFKLKSKEKPAFPARCKGLPEDRFHTAFPVPQAVREKVVRPVLGSGNNMLRSTQEKGIII